MQTPLTFNLRAVRNCSLVVAEKLNKQVGLTLGISEKTAKVHRERVMAKMKAESLAHFVRMAEKLPLPKVQSI